MRSVLEVADFLFATSQVALTTLRSTLGQAELDDLLTERDKVNRRLQEIIDGHRNRGESRSLSGKSRTWTSPSR